MIDRYFDVFIEYAKAGEPQDNLIKLALPIAARKQRLCIS